MSSEQFFNLHQITTEKNVITNFTEWSCGLQISSAVVIPVGCFSFSSDR